MLTSILSTIKRLNSAQLFRVIHAATDILDSRIVRGSASGYQSECDSDYDYYIKNDIKGDTDINVNIMGDDNSEKQCVKTEDLGKIFEMAICLTYNTPYVGKFKYSLDEARTLQSRLTKLPQLFPTCYHSAEKGGRYDFTSVDVENCMYLSAKTTKGDCKIAPQYIGQAQPSAFCERVGIPSMDIAELKCYIQEHIVEILPYAEEYTFSSPILYYNKKTDAIWYITQKEKIPWKLFDYEWTCGWETWNNSSTLKVYDDGKAIPILEVQFHTKSRSNMAVRWSFEKLLDVFGSYFDIVNL